MFWQIRLSKRVPKICNDNFDLVSIQAVKEQFFKKVWKPLVDYLSFNCENCGDRIFVGDEYYHDKN